MKQSMAWIARSPGSRQGLLTCKSTDLPGSILMGSSQMLAAGIELLHSKGITSLAEAWEMASARPAKLLNLREHGRLDAGAFADIVLFDLEGEHYHIHIREVYKQGLKVL
ncbi:amidohydrolase family protein [Paenibacillus agricola]|uniref:Amidohydrolase family protein n=1 Tax=Paenibacillus agricola TaxID=2716264 RepID=A0ABX0J5V6_9BACL|nr:amidohydrolase family protein [Paenibacillus agricola]NHN30544.1 amidohydrolase family protein [Paenibacillus agricola]